MYGPRQRNVAEGLDHCPGALARLPVVREARRAHAWWQKGQIGQVYPRGVPIVVMEAVELCEAVQAEFRAQGDEIRRVEAVKRATAKTE